MAWRLLTSSSNPFDTQAGLSINTTTVSTARPFGPDADLTLYLGNIRNTLISHGTKLAKEKIGATEATRTLYIWPKREKARSAIRSTHAHADAKTPCIVRSSLLRLLDRSESTWAPSSRSARCQLEANAPRNTRHQKPTRDFTPRRPQRTSHPTHAVRLCETINHRDHHYAAPGAPTYAHARKVAPAAWHARKVAPAAWRAAEQRSGSITRTSRERR